MKYVKFVLIAATLFIASSVDTLSQNRVNTDLVLLKKELVKCKNNAVLASHPIGDRISKLLHKVIYGTSDTLVSRKEKVDVLLYSRYNFFDNKLPFYRKVLYSSKNSFYYNKENSLFSAIIVLFSYQLQPLDMHKKIFGNELNINIDNIPEFYQLYFSIILKNLESKYDSIDKDDPPLVRSGFARVVLRMIFHSYLSHEIANNTYSDTLIHHTSNLSNMTEYKALNRILYDSLLNIKSQNSLSFNDSVSSLLHKVVFEYSNAEISMKKKLDILFLARYRFTNEQLKLFKEISQITNNNNSLFLKQENKVFLFVVLAFSNTKAELYKTYFENDFTCVKNSKVPVSYILFLRVIIDNIYKKYESRNDDKEIISGLWNRYFLAKVVTSFLEDRWEFDLPACLWGCSKNCVKGKKIYLTY